MNSGNFFRRSLIAALSLIFLLSTALVGATVKLYTATGEDYPSEVESQDTSKQRALDKAIKKATEQAGVYLKTYSRSINSELSDDEITAITSNAWQIVGEPKYTSEIINHSADTQIIVWKVTVEVNVDDSEIQSWIKRNDKDKSQIISQTREAQKNSAENERKIEDLREKYNRATSQAEKDNIRKQMTEADRDFLANQKLKEGLKLYYAEDYAGAIKLYNEALNIKPNNQITLLTIYFFRGSSYVKLKQYDISIQDIREAIRLSVNNKITDKILSKELQEYLSAIYLARGFNYLHLNQYKLSIQDFDEAIRLNQNNHLIYIGRSFAYLLLKQYRKTIQDCDKAIQINPNYANAYHIRGIAYALIENLDQAISDATKAIQLRPNSGEDYYWRGKYYQALGDTAKAQADFAKAKQLGYNG